MANESREAPAGPRRAVVIGGGLAGMVAAKELAKGGYKVIIVEAGSELGGKARAPWVSKLYPEDRIDPDYRVDHGYHVFPAWYRNTRALLDELGIADRLVPIREFHFLRKGQFPSFVTTYEVSSIRNLAHNMFHGIVPWHENLLSFYYLLDLAAEAFSDKGYLDRVSGIGFLRSRFYATETIANLHQQTVLQASAIPYYECSAMTLQKLFRAWMRHPSPLYSILDGNLTDRFIEPFRKRLEELGVEIRLNVKVEGLIYMAADDTMGGLVTSGETTFEDLNFVDDAVVVLATPHDVSCRLLAALEPTFERDQAAAQQAAASKPDGHAEEAFGLLNMVHLASAPMAAFSVRCKERIPGIPKEHVNLVGSRFGLSFLDISQHWGLEGTALDVISSHFEPLRHYAPEIATGYVWKELVEYVPALAGHYFSVDQRHIDEPLFLNTVGAWQHRPKAETGIPNLFMAGDFCQTDADLTTMESAVMSGLNAATAILARDGKRPDVASLPLETVPVWLLVLGKYLALPLIAPIGLWKRLRRRLGR
jgi:uncharacterized protein with NAD-binding domain and iron-sulfur cluster